jgi:hypothetical protein
LAGAPDKADVATAERENLKAGQSIGRILITEAGRPRSKVIGGNQDDGRGIISAVAALDPNSVP